MAEAILRDRGGDGMMLFVSGLVVGGCVGLVIAVIVIGSGRVSEDERVMGRVEQIQSHLRGVSDEELTRIINQEDAP